MGSWHMLKGETKIFETRISWKVFFHYYFLAILALIGAIGVWFYDPFSWTLPLPPIYMSEALGIASVLLLFLAIIHRRMEIVLVTNHRILINKGMFFSKNTNSEAISYSSLINIRIVQNRLEKIFNVGDVVFQLSNASEHKINNIDSPHNLEKAVYTIIEKEKELGLHHQRQQETLKK